MNSQEIFLSLGELGSMFAATSHEVGRWLQLLGLRVRGRDGKMHPSGAAFEGDYVQRASTGRNFGYHYKWHRDRTIEALVEAGHPLVIPQEAPDQPSNPRLIGPFEARLIGGNLYEIVGSDGLVAVTARGARNAAIIAQMMTIIYDNGKFD